MIGKKGKEGKEAVKKEEVKKEAKAGSKKEEVKGAWEEGVDKHEVDKAKQVKADAEKAAKDYAGQDAVKVKYIGNAKSIPVNTVEGYKNVKKGESFKALADVAAKYCDHPHFEKAK